MGVEGIHPVQHRRWSDDEQARSEEYLKKHPSLVVNNPADLQTMGISTIESMKPEPVASLSLEKKSNNRNFLDTAWKWLNEKWDSVLEFIGVKSPALKPAERDRTKRAKIREGQSTQDIDEDFKYIDIATMDPLKVMLTLLVKQGELREEQALLVQQKILLMQEDLKDLHEQRMLIHAELALIGKRSGVLEKVDIAITVGQVLGGIAITASMVAGAAAIATMGAAAPAVGVVGIIAAVINGITYGAKAFHTWLTADTKEKMDKLQGEMLVKNAAREDVQFQLRVDVRDMGRIFRELIGQAETGNALLIAQSGK